MSTGKHYELSELIICTSTENISVERTDCNPCGTE